MPLSPSLEVVETQFLEATYPPAEPPCESSDPAFQVSKQRDTEPDTQPDREPEFENGSIKNTLVIEPTHPANSGAYYCATADDVAKLIVKNQGDYTFSAHVVSASAVLTLCAASSNISI